MGFKADGNKPKKVSFSVRTVLFNEHNQLGIVKSAKHGYTQVPGGSLDEGETIEEAMRRETAEEMGFTVKDIKPIGFFQERRESSLNSHSWTIGIVFVFQAKTAENIGTNYMEDEIGEGFAPTWVNFKDALKEKETAMQEILASKASYSGTFSNYRDLAILKFFRDNHLV